MNRARRRSCQLLVDDRASQVRERIVIRFWYADRPDLTDPRAERRVLGKLSAAAGPHRFRSGRHAGLHSVSGQSGQDEVYVHPVDGGTGIMVSVDGSTEPA